MNCSLADSPARVRAGTGQAQPTTSSGVAPHGATRHSMAPHGLESDRETPIGATSPRAAYGCAVLLEDTPHGMAPCSAMLHGGTPHGTASHGKTSHSTTSSGTAPHGATQCSMAPHRSESDSKTPSSATLPRVAYSCVVSLEDTPHGVAPRHVVSHGGTPHCTALHSAAWLSIAPHSTTPHSTALYSSPSSSRKCASPRATQ